MHNKTDINIKVDTTTFIFFLKIGVSSSNNNSSLGVKKFIINKIIIPTVDIPKVILKKSIEVGAYLE